MPKYLFVYRGGKMAETPEAQEAAMAAWGGWFGALGDALLDPGGPVGQRAHVGGDAPDPTTGYSLLEVDSLDAATALADGCPVLANGGRVEVAEMVPIAM